ncbi:hypothetical protein OU587_02780, partial [Escherichia coli]|nr:hypothetical protein [Escherichia coli]
FFCSLLAPSDAILFQEGVSVKLRLPHTYACWSLTAGANPAFIANQMGHADAQMVFQVYGKWMSENNNAQVALLNTQLSEFAPTMPHNEAMKN